VVIVEGRLSDSGHRRFAIVVSRWNSLITQRLEDGCRQTLARHGIAEDQLTLVRVPGCFELPLAAQQMAETGQFDAVICLGALIRGATPHFDYIASACASGLTQTGLRTGVPVIFGVLTCDTIEQAIERAGTKAGNKGEEAATAALEMADVMAQLLVPQAAQDAAGVGADDIQLAGS
jgi:6,7-dimethyl-8-ribityllumazine synthase